MSDDQAKDFVDNLKRVGRDASPEECALIISELLDARRVVRNLQRSIAIVIGIAFALLLLFIFALRYALTLGHKIGGLL